MEKEKEDKADGVKGPWANIWPISGSHRTQRACLSGVVMALGKGIQDGVGVGTRELNAMNSLEFSPQFSWCCLL